MKYFYKVTSAMCSLATTIYILLWLWAILFGTKADVIDINSSMPSMVLLLFVMIACDIRLELSKRLLIVSAPVEHISVSGESEEDE